MVHSVGSSLSLYCPRGHGVQDPRAVGDAPAVYSPRTKHVTWGRHLYALVRPMHCPTL